MGIVEDEADVIFDNAEAFGGSVCFGIENTENAGVGALWRGSFGSWVNVGHN